jgi:hypothetical protein
VSVREEVHQLVDTLSEQDLHTVKRLLRGLALPEEGEGDPLLAALSNAPIDDEPDTEEERQVVAESWAAYERGERIPHTEMLHRTREKAP